VKGKQKKIIHFLGNGGFTGSGLPYSSFLIYRAIPVAGDATTYIGTHLQDNRVSGHEEILYATAGMKIEIT